MVTQGTVNTLFWCRDLAPVLMYQIVDPLNAYNYTKYQYGSLDQSVYGGPLEHIVHGGSGRFLGADAGFLRLRRPADGMPAGDATSHTMRALRAGGSSLATNTGATFTLTGLEAGAFMSVQSMVVLSSFLRLLYFFRANIEFGSLVPSVVQIIFDSLPIIVLLLIVTLGFTFALLVLLQCELSEEAFPDFHDPFRMLFTTVNMGLYTYFDGSALSLDRHPQVLVLYQVFMFIVQIVTKAELTEPEDLTPHPVPLPPPTPIILVLL